MGSGTSKEDLEYCAQPIVELIGQYTSWIEDLRFEVEEKNKKLEEKNLVMNKLSKENDKYNALTEKTNKKKDGK